MSASDRPTVPNDACAHKQASHWHGTHACYVHDRCRCEDCRAANARYEKSRAKWLAGVVEQPYVDADQARKLIEELQNKGLGLKRIAAVSGVSHGALWKLVYGKNGRPSKRCRQETVDKLTEALDALLWEEATVADGAKVDATEAKLIVKELVARGWTRTAIASRIAGEPRASLQAVTKATAQVQAKTLRVLRELMCEPVPMRVHSPTGKLYQPKPNRKPRAVPRLVDGVGGPIFREPMTTEDRIVDLLDLEGWMTYAEIAHRLGIGKGAVSAVIARLGDRVVKRTVDVDGQRNYVEVRLA